MSWLCNTRFANVWKLIHYLEELIKYYFLSVLLRLRMKSIHLELRWNIFLCLNCKFSYRNDISENFNLFPDSNFCNLKWKVLFSTYNNPTGLYKSCITLVKQQSLIMSRVRNENLQQLADCFTYHFTPKYNCNIFILWGLI